MNNPPYFFKRLELAQDADERAVRRAYARELKLIDQETNPVGFQSLRETYDAALLWVRHRKDSGQESPRHSTSEAGDVGTVPTSKLVLHHIDEYGEQHVNHEALADAVFSEFLQRCKTMSNELDQGDDAWWVKELQISLADVRLINIGARDVFERRIADLLTRGWQPGHEAMFVAAIAVFDWADDRRRVSGLGPSAKMLDTAIDERTVFDQQTSDVRLTQRRLIARWRDPKYPGVQELIRTNATLETLASRFPTWLALITNIDNIVLWRALYEKVPHWRRKLSFKTFRRSKAPSYERRGRGGFNWVGLVCMALWILSRIATSDLGSHKPEPVQHETAADLIDRANQLLNNNDYAGAIATYDRTIMFYPKHSMAYADRAMAYELRSIAYKSKPDEASSLSDLEKAAELDAANPVVYRVRGLMAVDERHDVDAISAFTRSIELDPSNSFTYFQRALVYEKTGQNVKAIADADEAIKLDPNIGTNPYKLRARAFLALGDRERAANQAEIVIKTNPAESYVYIAAAQILKLLKQNNEGMAILDRGIAKAPDSALYIEHAQLRNSADIVGRRHDIEAALALDSHSTAALSNRAQLEFDTKNFDAATTTLTSVLIDTPEPGPRRAILLAARGIAYAKLGKVASAESDFSAAQEADTTSQELNNICWFIATNNVLLNAALSACEAALLQDAHYSPALDSKAFVLLRLKRYLEAIKFYNNSLELSADRASSLFGRGIAKSRLGDAQGSSADLRAAQLADSTIAQTFATFGILP